MPIKKYNPTSPARRYHTVLVNDDLTTSKPHKPLVEKLDQSGGRNQGDGGQNEDPHRFAAAGHEPADRRHEQQDVEPAARQRSPELAGNRHAANYVLKVHRVVQL